MKTPREILLARHRAAEARLDAIRRAVVSELNHPVEKAQRRTFYFESLVFSCFTTFWRELILPSRRIWTGLAAVWLVLIILNGAQREPVSSVTGQPVRSPAMTASWQVQQHWMNELLADRSAPPESERPQNAAPKPRTQTHEMRLL